jgi:hypothetical protein
MDVMRRELTPVEPMPVKGAVLAAPNVGAGVPKSEVVAVGVPKSEFVAAGVPKSEDVAAGVPKSEDVDAGAPKSEGVCVAGAPEEAPNNPVEGVVEVPNNPPGVVGGVEPGSQQNISDILVGKLILHDSSKLN